MSWLLDGCGDADVDDIFDDGFVTSVKKLSCAGVVANDRSSSARREGDPKESFLYPGQRRRVVVVAPRITCRMDDGGVVGLLAAAAAVDCLKTARFPKNVAAVIIMVTYDRTSVVKVQMMCRDLSS